MAFAAVAGAVAGPLIGGLLGGKSSGAQQSQKQELDPRIQAMLYGNGGEDRGLLNDVNDLRKKQLAQGGLNPMQRAGMEMQRQNYMSPQYTQGYDQMRNMGSQLMGAGVAGNPFANGGSGNIGGGVRGQPMQSPMSAMQAPMQQMQPFQYQQNDAMQGAQNPFEAAAPMPQQSAPFSAVSPEMEQYIKAQKQRDEEIAQYGRFA